jgi:hypothetical protein
LGALHIYEIYKTMIQRDSTWIINLLCIDEVVGFLEKIEHCAAAPGLGVARIAAVGAIAVGEFWETSPRVGLYVTARREDIGV